MVPQNGYGNPNVCPNTRCLLGWLYTTDWTPMTWCYVAIGMLLMIIHVSFVELRFWRIGLTYFLTVSSLLASGHICKLTGTTIIWMFVFPKRRNISKGPVWLRLSPLPAGISGSNGMDGSSKNVKPSFWGWKGGFVLDVTLLKYRLKASVLPLLELWLSNLL